MRTIPLPKKATRRGDVVHRLWFSPQQQQIVVLLGHHEGASVLCWMDASGETAINVMRVGDAEHDCAVPCPNFSRDHRYLAVPGKDSVSGEIAVIEQAAQLARRVTLEGPKGPGLYDQYGSTAFSPDGASLFAARSTASSGQTWLIHRWATVAGLNDKKKRVRPVPDSELSFDSPCGPVDVAVSPNGMYLATITYDGGAILVWELGKGEVVSRMKLPAQRQRLVTVYDQHLLFSPNGRTLVAAGAVLAVFEVGSWKLRQQLEAKSKVCGMAFHPRSSKLATVNRSKEICIWDVESCKAERLPCRRSVQAVSISDDGAMMVAGGENGHLVQWEWARLATRKRE